MPNTTSAFELHLLQNTDLFEYITSFIFQPPKYLKPESRMYNILLLAETLNDLKQLLQIEADKVKIAENLHALDNESVTYIKSLQKIFTEIAQLEGKNRTLSDSAVIKQKLDSFFQASIESMEALEPTYRYTLFDETFKILETLSSYKQLKLVATGQNKNQTNMLAELSTNLSLLTLSEGKKEDIRRLIDVYEAAVVQLNRPSNPPQIYPEIAADFIKHFCTFRLVSKQFKNNMEVEFDKSTVTRRLKQQFFTLLNRKPLLNDDFYQAAGAELPDARSLLIANIPLSVVNYVEKYRKVPLYITPISLDYIDNKIDVEMTWMLGELILPLGCTILSMIKNWRYERSNLFNNIKLLFTTTIPYLFIKVLENSDVSFNDILALSLFVHTALNFFVYSMGILSLMQKSDASKSSKVNTALGNFGLFASTEKHTKPKLNPTLEKYLKEKVAANSLTSEEKNQLEVFFSAPDRLIVPKGFF